MGVNKDQMITFPKVLKKLPAFLVNLPETLKGLQFNRLTDRNLPVGLGKVFDDIAKSTPNNIAIVSEEAEYTYKEFNEWSNRIANHFIEEGYKKGDAVVVLIENRAELLATVLGLAKVGIIASMVNTSQRGKVLTYSINLANAKVAVVGAELVEAYEEVRANLDIEDDIPYWIADSGEENNAATATIAENYKDLMDDCADASHETPIQTQRIFIDDSAFYIYTSGTTGLPKAVDFNHGRFMKAIGGFGHSSMHLKGDDRIMVTLPFYHSTALAVCWGAALAGQGGVIVTRKFSASNFWSDAIKYKATAFGYVGELCRYLLAQPERPIDKEHKIRKMVGNGLRTSIWKEFKSRFLIEGVYEFYASSEGNVGFTNLFNFDETVGFCPMSYAIVKYDREEDRPVEDKKGFLIKAKKGEAGLLIGKITKKSPFKGYTDPEKTKKVVLNNVFELGDSWFNTGDIMRDIGFRHAQFVDRTGDTFRWKSENVSTSEVENVLNDCENVEEAVVYGVEIPGTVGRAGMAQLKLKVAIEDFDFKAFTQNVQKNLPFYAVPLFLRFDEKLEQTGTFKYQKSKLKENGYDLAKNSTPVYVLLPKAETYMPITPEIENKINRSEYRF